MPWIADWMEHSARPVRVYVRTIDPETGEPEGQAFLDPRELRVIAVFKAVYFVAGVMVGLVAGLCL